MKAQYSKKISFGFCSLVALIIALIQPAARAESDRNVTNEISQASVFYQKLMWVGDTPPSQSESEKLVTILTDMKNSGIESNRPQLEKFLTDHPNSPWNASIRANLGRYCFENGLSSQALAHWEAAWDATRSASQGDAKKVADFTFAYWTRLLASLGRTEKLKELFEETKDRIFDRGPLQQVVNASKEGYRVMLSDPGSSYKCGTFALRNVALSLKTVKEAQLREIDDTKSPPSGFNMTRLMDMAKNAGLEFVAVKWPSQTNLIIPSVIHWKQNHFAAVVEYQQDHYRLIDPTSGRSTWLSRVHVLEEASGHFIVPKDRATADWVTMSKTETDAVYGRGAVYGADDFNDCCANGSGGNGGSSYVAESGPGSPGWGGSGGYSMSGGLWAGNNSGGQGGGCGSCMYESANLTGGSGSAPCQVCPIPGMATWEVSEPYISLWIYDQPLGYQPAFGERFAFTMAYKQREDRVPSANFYSFGPMWNCFWLNYIVDDSPGLSAKMIVGGGGERTYVPNNITREFFTRTTLQRTTNMAGNLTGFILSHADGAKDYYSFVPTNMLNAKKVAFLTEKVNAHGLTNWFYYDEISGVTRLRYILDAEGKTNSLTYTNLTFPAQVTGVEDRFGRKAFLQYDTTDGAVVSIIDPVGIASSFVYDEKGWITNLVTPYGTTKFEHHTNSVVGPYEFLNDQNLVTRAIRVTDTEGGRNVYFIRQNSQYAYDPLAMTVSAPFLELHFDTSDTSRYPSGVPTPSLDWSNFQYRNSFHWGPKQAVGLPSVFDEFQVSHYLKARMRHWLKTPTSPNVTLSQVLSIQQEPSPDGVTKGQMTWYDYDGKPEDTYFIGTNSQPSLIAQVIPDGTTAYSWIRRDEWGRATNIVQTYSLGYGQTPLPRTNVLIYGGADNTELVAQIGRDGTVEHGYAYDGNHNVVRHTNGVQEVIFYTYNAKQQLTKVIRPSGLTTTNVFFTSGDYAGWLDKAIDIEIFRTNSYTYVDGLVFTHTNERGTTITNTWDALQRLRRVDYPDSTFVTNGYSKLDVVTTVDRMGFATSYKYDTVRRMTAQTNAVGHFTLYNYCSCGALDSVRDAEGNFTFYRYDNSGRLTSTLYADGYAVTNNFDLLGRTTNVINSGFRSTTNWFNNQGLQYAVSNAFGRVSVMAFDIADRATNAIDANNLEMAMTYDAIGRLRTRVYADTGTEQFGYSPRGVEFYTNQLNKITQYIYDAAGRQNAEANANNEIVMSYYDASGNITNLIDGKNQNIFWNYDEYGRVTNKIDNLNNVLCRYQYDSNGRLTNRWMAAQGANTIYRYDPVGNLTNVDYAASPALHFRYDALHRLTNMVDGVGTTRCVYDGVGQILSEDGPWDQDTVSYSYDNQLRSTMNLMQPNATRWQTTYGYDGASRLTNIVSVAGAFAYAYDSLRHLRVQRLSLPPGSAITNQYDSLARLTSTALRKVNGDLVSSHAYNYNVGNQRTKQTRTEGSFVEYIYDSIGQLTNASGKEVGGSISRKNEQFGYRYDGTGNLTNRNNNGFAECFAVNSLNELTGVNRPTGAFTVAGTTTSEAIGVTVNGSAATLYDDNTFVKEGMTLADGNNTFTAAASDASGRSSIDSVTVYLPTNNVYSYDLNGNLVSDGRRGFEYDDENQLIKITFTNVWKSEFVYDGRRRRRISKEYAWQANNWVVTNEIRYVYDGALVIQERDENNIGEVTYTRGRDVSGGIQEAGGIGGLLARSANGRMLGNISSPHAYYHSDGGGSITCLVNVYESIVARYTYDPFGNVISSSGVLAESNVYRFSGKEHHSKSGLNYFLDRYYDPTLQRWLNRDPSEEVDGPNLYSFANNRVINFSDSDGRSGWGFATPGVEIHFRNGQWEYWKAGPDPAGERCMKQCAAEVFGWETATGAALAAAGQPILPKAPVLGGSTATSPAARAADKIFGDVKLNSRVWAPTNNNPLARTRSVARLAGRWAPIIGWCLLANDLRQFANCVDKCMGRK